ncbi:MAG: tryptophan synthase subunit alpha [Flavobacteriia bacterium]|nr:tryptophan synthase subunit alpha [Flavobacteriia bacterium]
MNPFIKNKKQLSIFITAGFPTLNSTTNQILELQSKGVDFIEVGIPFSDPMADGVVIQESSSKALSNGMNMDILFDQLEAIKNDVHIPLVLMGYLNPVLQYGLEKFLIKCKDVKMASVILPDMSFEIYERFYQSLFEKYEIPMTFLITPTSSDERILKIVESSKKSFVYLVSHTSITGNKQTFQENLLERYSEIKALCKNVPLMIGFGISTKNDVEKAHKSCDGAIIGSAYIKSLIEKRDLVRELTP